MALAISLLVHALIVFTPMVELPPSEPLLPPLQAKLEPLPRQAATVAPKEKPKPLPKPAPAVAETVATDTPSEPPVTDEPRQIDPEPQPPEAAEPELVATKPSLPDEAQLTFILFMGTDSPVGESRHHLKIENGRYTLTSAVKPTGWMSFITFDFTETSSGSVDARGLQPDSYHQHKKTNKGEEDHRADFNWTQHRVSFANGSSSELQAGAQDMLSFLYQLAQLPQDRDAIPLYISNGKKLESYQLAIGNEEFINTRMGRLRTLPLRKIIGPGEEGLEVWLGLEYRMLPVKIRHLNRSGKTAAEMVISDIRVADK
ncbi:MAG: DUF3108 domain-containing protein [Gallionella sp.]|nr:DUF3108 domain-containing protein [Gallionella sp.]